MGGGVTEGSGVAAVVTEGATVLTGVITRELTGEVELLISRVAVDTLSSLVELADSEVSCTKKDEVVALS